MKTKNKLLALLEIAIVLCSVFLVAIPAIAAEQSTQEISANTITTASKDDYVLGIYGNANEDDTIDMRDLTYVKLIFFGKKPETELADAKYDGKINPLDFIQIKLIIVGKEKEITIEDGNGEVVTVPKPVKRIVTLYRDSAEALRALSAEDKIIGVTEPIKEDNIFFPELSKLPSVGSWSKPDYEAILNLNPDVVLPLGAWKKEQKEKIPGITVIYLGLFYPQHFTDGIRKLGYILNKKEEAGEFVNWGEDWINKVKTRTKGLSEDEKPRIFYWWNFKPGGGGYKTRKSSGANDMIIVAGGKRLFEDIEGYEVDPEWVIENNPDIIVAIAYHGWTPYGYSVDDPSEMAVAREDILNRPELANINAVKTKSVYILGGYIENAGSGSCIGTTYMAKWFHPDLFKDLDPQAIHQEYLDRFQHLDYDLDKHGVFVYPEPS